MASPISPAPSTRTRLPSRPPRRSVGHGHRGLRHRRGAAGDGRVGAGPLADLERVAEQQVERRTGGALLAGLLPRVADLAEDLALAEDDAVEPGGHREQVGHGRRVVVDVEVVAEVLGGQEGGLGQEVADVLVGPVELLGHRVDLGAVARGEHDGLGHVLAVHQVVEGLRERGVADGHPLEQVERSAPVVQSDDDDGQLVGSLCGYPCSGGVEMRPRAAWSRSRASSDRPAPEVVQHPRIEGGPPIRDGPVEALRRRAPHGPPTSSSRSASCSGPTHLAEAVAEPSGQGRAVPRGRHGDQQRAPVEAGRAGWPSSCAGSSAALTKTPAASPSRNTWRVHGRVVGGGDHEPVAGHLPGLVGPLLPGDGLGPHARRRPRRATTCTTAPAATRPATLRRGHRAAADHQHPPSLEQEHHRVRPGVDGASVVSRPASAGTSGASFGPPERRCW